MSDGDKVTQAVDKPDDYERYDGRRLSYATSYSDPWKVAVIRTIEWVSGKILLLRRIREFERLPHQKGHAFFSQVLKVMRINVNLSQDVSQFIPQTGPVVLVANHPHGLVDGLVMAEIVGKIRTDYKILVRSLLTGVKEIDPFMLSVPFPHEENAHRKSIDMRNQAMEHLKAGGVIVLFPAGAVSASDTWFGKVREKEWNPFTAKMIMRSGATVVPIYFPGQNTRLYQIANKISDTLRQSLLLHEIARSMNKDQNPVLGAPIAPEELEKWRSDPRGFMKWLRNHVLSLRN